MHCKRQLESVTYFLFDSHARGAKSFKPLLHGAVCCMRFKNIDDLYTVLRKNLTVNNSSNQYTLNVSLTSLILTSIPFNDSQPHTNTHNSVPIFSSTTEIDEHALQRARNFESIKIIETTSMLCSVEETVPALESVVDFNNADSVTELRLVEIKRKTRSAAEFATKVSIRRAGLVFSFPRW